MLIASIIILQLLIFGVLIYVFKKVMSQNVSQATQHLDEMSHDYEKKELEVNKQISEVKQKADEIIARAQEEAQKLKSQSAQEVETERDSIIKSARTQSDEMIEQADKARKLLLSQMEERVSREAVNKACELIQLALPEEFKQEVHAHWVRELIENGFKQIKNLHVPADLQEIRVISALALTEEQRRGLSKEIKESLGKDIAIKEEIDPKLVAGIVIGAGSLMLDGSLKNKIMEKAKL